jgi:ribonuclease HI
MCESITIYADGGGASTSLAAGAGCVVEADFGKLVKLVGFLGKATNNEAEITALLMGLAYVRCLNQGRDGAAGAKNYKQQLDFDFEPKVDFQPCAQVRVVSDSEYTLKSATGYIFNWIKKGWKTAAKEDVKNQGLWRVYLKLVQGILLEAEHVKGHSGHLFNEACDKASTWSRLNGEAEADELVKLVNIPKNPVGEDWILIDLREFLNFAREGKIEQATSQLETSINLTRRFVQ